MTETDDDVRLTILHTSDWHLGRGFGLFGADDATKLRRQRFTVVEDIIARANQEADLLLVAGDIFDTGVPADEIWRGLALRLKALKTDCQAFLLPGNHDPITNASPFYRTHPFRAELRSNVHVVDREDFVYELPDRGAVLYAVAVDSRAGADDPMRKLPKREPCDERIRIAMAHGQAFTFGDSASPHPIDASAAAALGFDYVAIGDFHDPKCMAESNANGVGRVQYCGTPEPMTFGEGGAGHVLIVGMRPHGLPPRVEQVRVGGYRWRQETCESLENLEALVDDPTLPKTVLRLTLDFSTTLPGRRRVDGLIKRLQGTDVETGRVGILEELLDRVRVSDAAYAQGLPADAPPSLEKVHKHLLTLLHDPEQGERAKAALRHLHTLASGDNP